MEVTTSSTEETKELANKIAEKLKPNTVVALYGDLGAGKTTFTSYLTKALGIDTRVQSPTFVIARNYASAVARNPQKITNVIHIDLYRITNAVELEDLDLPEFFSKENSITVIEWPEIAEALFTGNTVRIYFTYIDDDTRKIEIQNLY